MRIRILLPLSVLLLLAVLGLNLTRRPAPSPAKSTKEIERVTAAPASARSPGRPRLPAPRLTSGPTAAESVPTDITIRMLNGEGFPALTRTQLEKYLHENKRSAESLIAAARASGDLTLLREAATRFPTDPRVQFDLALRGESPEEKRNALDAFRQLATDNPLGDYLSALDRFKSGRTDDAVKDLLQAATKTKLQDYANDQAQIAEEAYLSAGYGTLEAKIAGSSGVALPHLQPLRDLASQMTELQRQYSQSGDAASAQAIGQMGLNLAWQMENQPGRTLITELMGMAIEKKFLTAQAPDTAFGSDGRTVRDRLAELDAQRQSIRELTDHSRLLPGLPQPEALIYYDRLRQNGELDALRWLKNKHGTP